MDRAMLMHFVRDTNQISTAAATAIAGQFEYKEIAKNALLLREGKVCDDYLFLEKGYMRAFAHDTEGAEVTTNFWAPGQLVFEVSSFFSRSRAKENIQALTDCGGWAITYAQLNSMFHTMPEFRDFGRAMLVRGYTGLKTRTLSMITETGEERYSQLLEHNPEIFQHAPLKYIASYLGMTDTSLSRIRKELSKK